MAVSGVDEFEDFADNIEGVSDGLSKAKKDALRDTARDFKRILKDVIMETETSKGGTLYSETSPYSAGGENESTRSNKHMRSMGSWEHELIGDDAAVIYPHPDIRKRVGWLEYGTDDHGPSGDKPMFFEVGNKLIVVSERTDRDIGFINRQVGQGSFEARMDERYEDAAPSEVEGVEPQKFLKRAVRVADEQNIYKNNLEEQISQLFADNELPLEDV